MNPLSTVANYFRTSKAELEKVSWPTRQQTIRYSVIVVVASLAAAAFFGFLDFALGRGVEAILFRTTPATQQEQTVPTTTPQPIQLNPTDVEATTLDGRATDIQITPGN